MSETNITKPATIEQLLLDIDATGKNYDKQKIIKAYEYAAMLHEGQFRQS